MNNSFDCTWHLLTSTCTDSDINIEKNESMISNSSVHQCPHYNVSIQELFIADGDSFILGKKDQVIIQTLALRSSIQKYFRCVLTLINGSLISTEGKIRNDSLVCDPFQVR